jgi:hypothetical protein
MPRMGTAGIKRVVLDLDMGEPIRGTIGVWGRRAEAFHGWLELAGKLERLRADPTAVDVTPTNAPTGPGATPAGQGEPEPS